MMEWNTSAINYTPLTAAGYVEAKKLQNLTMNTIIYCLYNFPVINNPTAQCMVSTQYGQFCAPQVQGGLPCHPARKGEKKAKRKKKSKKIEVY